MPDALTELLEKFENLEIRVKTLEGQVDRLMRGDVCTCDSDFSDGTAYCQQCGKKV